MMREFRYKIFNPGGNKTALVFGNNYSNYEKARINQIILNNNKDVEQVGFLSNKERKLEMAGGEFCVNATRCAIWKYLNKTTGNILIQVSGCKELIEGGIDRENNVFAKIKINKNISEIIQLGKKFNYVELDGILLAVMNENNSKEYIQKIQMNQEKTKKELKKIMKNIDTEQKAVGVILLEEFKDFLKIYPIIWVKTIDTLYYETACGSGSLAVSIYKNYITNKSNFEILQPSGYSINVSLKIDSNILKEGIVSGKVIEENGGMNYGRI